MKKLFTLLTMLIVGIGSSWATVDTQIIKVSTSTSDPEHVYFMHSQENDSYFATQDAYASNTAASAAKFAFFQATDANGNVINNAYYIYCVNNSKWMSYSKAASYPDGQNFVTMTTNDKTSANYFKFEHVSMTESSVSGKKAYLIHPYNTSGPGSRCLNWYNGVTKNTNSTIGLYTNGAGTAGNGWAFIEAPRIGRYYRIKSCKTNKYLATNSTTENTDNTTLYCYTDKGLAQVSSGKYYNSSSKAVGTTQYTANIQFNLNASRGAFQFATNGYWTYCKNDGGLDGGTTMNTDVNYAWDFEEVENQFPFTFAATLNDIQDAKWYNLTVRGQYLYYNADGTFHDGTKDATPIVPQATDKTAWFAFVGDPFRGFQIVNFASAALFGSSNVNTDTRIKAVRPSDAATYVFEIVSYSDNLAWQIRDTRGDNAFLNQQGTNLGIWNYNARGDHGNVFTITEVEGAAAEHFVTYNIVATDVNGEHEISWNYDRLYEPGQTTGETPEALPFVSDYYCADPTLSGPVCNLTYTATHTMPFVSGKYYFMRQRKNDATPKNGYAYYDPDRSANGMPKTNPIGDTENYLWKFVGNPYDGYCIYNKSQGEDKGLFINNSGGSLQWSSSPSYFILGTMSTADTYGVLSDGGSSTYFKLKGSDYNCLHDLSNVLNNWNSSGSVTDAGSIIGFYEAEEYTVTVVTPEGFPGGGGITANGKDYANGDYFCVVKGTAIKAKDVDGYASDVSIVGSTITVTYRAATVSLTVIYRYKENDGDEWTTLKNPGVVNVSDGVATSVLVSLTADETKKFTGGTFQIGEGETSNFTMNSFAESYDKYISVTASENATLYINLRVRPLPTTGKLYRFYNVNNSMHWMYNNGTRLGVTAHRKSDKSDMFYLLETGTAGVYKFVSALNGNGYNEVTWNNLTNPVKFERTGRITFDRYTTDKEFSIYIGQYGKSGTTKYLHANGSDDGHVVVVWEEGSNSRWYAEEVPISEVADPELEIAKIEANRILNKRGVGYPTTSSSAYSTLNTAINANNATVESINTAVTAYKSVTTATDIQMPEDGKTYTITAVAKDDTKRFYMKYASDGYTLNATTGLYDGSYPNTTYLTCKKIGEKYAFVNNDGKYFIFKGSNAGANSNKGYLDEYNSSHNFTVGRMSKTDYCTSNNDAYIGYVYMVGLRGDNTAGCFVHKPNRDYDQASVPFFNDNFSSALVLDEVVSHTLSLAAKKSLAKIDIAESGKTFAEGLGNYHVVAGGEISYDANSSISEATTNAEVDAILSSAAINMPANGFYRFTSQNNSHQKGNVGKYIHNDLDNVVLVLTETKDEKTIFYVDCENNRILSYADGKYLYYWDQAPTVGNSGTWTIMEGSEIGKYAIKIGSSNWYASDWNTTDHITNGLKDANALWAIEPVESLPLTLAANSYTSFSAPVAITIPDNCKAYIAKTKNNNTIKMEEVTGNIPANTGIIIGTEADANPTFTVYNGSDFAKCDGNILASNVAASALSRTDNYFFGKQRSTGNYIFTMLSGDGDNYTLYGHKAYLPKENLASVEGARISIIWGDDDSTGLEELNDKNIELKDGKYYQDGNVVVVRNGVKYNVAGQIIK